MASRTVKVTTRKQGKEEISEVFTLGVAAWAKLVATGFDDAVRESFRLARKGGCTGYELFGQLFMMWMAQLRGQRALQKEASSCSEALALAIGSRQWRSQSSMSRALAAVTPEQSREFADWLLTEALPATLLDRDESTFHHDTFGERWRFYDTDGRVRAMRQRGLPEGEDLPEPVRRAQGLAKPGYPGRKRGEVQDHQMLVQDAGTGRYLGIRLAPGNGEHHAEMVWAAVLCALWSDRIGVELARAILRFDGKSSGLPSLLACREVGIGYLTRWTDYTLLESTEFLSRRASEQWQPVPDSGSGPKREAMEMGVITVAPDETFQDASSAQVEPMHVRVVVSRYRLSKEKKHGCGKEDGEFVYELYATSLLEDAWPAAETVEVYYGRTAEENRFGQLDRELPYDHIVSWHLPGQEFALATALFTSNLRLLWGAELAGWRSEPLPSPPARQGSEERPSEVTPQPLVDIATTSAPDEHRIAPPPETDDTGAELPANQADESLESAETPLDVAQAPIDSRASMRVWAVLLAQLCWTQLLSRLPGWRWSDVENTLYCPAGQPTYLQNVRPLGLTKCRAVFRIRGTTACRHCKFRPDCTSSTNPRLQKEVSLAIPMPDNATLPKIVDRDRAQRSTPSSKALNRRTYIAATQAKKPGPYTAAAPALVPSVLRNTPIESLRAWRVSIQSYKAQQQARKPKWLATTAAERQHRRLTWSERDRRALLPDNVALNLSFAPPHGIPREQAECVTKSTSTGWNYS